MKKLLGILGGLSLPLMAFAQDTGLSTATDLAGSISRIINILIPTAFALAVLFFFWGVAMFIFGGDGDKEAAKGRMLWGIIAIFVMSSIWGLVRFLGGTLGLNDNSSIAPQVTLPRVTQ